MAESKKVPISGHQGFYCLYTLVHVVAIMGAVVIICFNLFCAWVGKELQGQVSEDGQKLFALQLTAKVHELFMLVSLSQIAQSSLINRLAAGCQLPLASLGAGLRFQDGSYLFSQECLALCTARFEHKARLIGLLGVSMFLALTVGPSSATAMAPILDQWPAPDVQFAINASHDQMWPMSLNGSLAPQNLGTVWESISQGLFTFWGHETIGGVLAAPETVSIPGSSSVRSLEVRFRGPFSLYQPQYTAVSVQMEVIADAVNNVRLPWYSNNAVQCSWAKGRVFGRMCTWKDITWQIRALQPVVYSKCLGNTVPQAVSFPTLTRGAGRPESARASVGGIPSVNVPAGTPGLHWLDLQGSDFEDVSVGVLVQTNAFAGSEAVETFACSVDAQWAESDVKTTFLSTPYVVSGSPSDFFIPTEPTGRYRGQRVAIDPKWASQLNDAPVTAGTNETIFERLVRSGAPTEAEAKVAAVLAVMVAQSMASLGATSVIQGNIPDRFTVLDSIEAAAKDVEGQPGYRHLTLQTAISGYAYGIRSASGVSTSNLLSVIILSCYVVVAASSLILRLRLRYHVRSWTSFTDIIALALNSSPGPDMVNTSCGVASIETLRLPVSFAVRDDSVEMVVGDAHKYSKRTHRALERDIPYS